MKKKFIKGGLLSAAIIGCFPATVMAGECPDRFESTQFDYLGRNANNTKSYWLTTSNRPDSFLVSSPGVPEIDRWQSDGPSSHITESTVVLNDYNGIHYVDRMKPNGSYDCLLQTRGQSNPMLPPTWRPPAKPERPEVVRPELPDRPTAVKPGQPELPVVVRPGVPDRPVVVRPDLPDRPTAIKPGQPELPVVVRPGVPDRPVVVRPDLPDRPTAIKPGQPELPVVVRPEVPNLPEVVRPELPDRPTAVKPGQPDLPVAVRPEQPDRPTAVKPDQPIVISLNGQHYQFTTTQLMQYCPSIQFDAAGQIVDESLRDCNALINTANGAPLTPGRDLLAPTEWNAWADLQYQSSKNRRGYSPIDGKAGTLSLGADRLLNPDFSLGAMLTFSNQDTETFAGRLTSESDSVMFGPYFAYRLNPNWSLFGNIMAGRVSQEYRVLTLSGDRSAAKYSAGLNVEGDYAIGEASFIRPKLGITYSYDEGKSYQLAGSVLGRQLQIVVDGKSHDSGQMQASAEFNTRLKTQKGQIFVPYLETGMLYNYLQASQASNPNLQGLVRAGLRTVAAKSVQIDVNASYQSIGASDLDVWDVKLFVSHAF